MGVQNAKAGALDIALRLTDPAATHVVVVDADYAAAPGFLRRAAGLIARNPDACAVQFSQAYRRADRAPGLAADFSRFFTTEAPVAAQAGVMLLTGTMSVIARDALRGGWTTRTITEDAEMGLQLIRAGGRIVLSDEVVGRGLMPLTRDGLTRQRTRWVIGNLQVARRLPRVLRAGTPRRMRLALAAAAVLARLAADADGGPAGRRRGRGARAGHGVGGRDPDRVCAGRPARPARAQAAGRRRSGLVDGLDRLARPGRGAAASSPL